MYREKLKKLVETLDEEEAKKEYLKLTALVKARKKRKTAINE